MQPKAQPLVFISVMSIAPKSNTAMKIRALLFAALLLTSGGLKAQGLSTTSTDFWFGFLPHFGTPADATQVNITSASNSTVVYKQYVEHIIHQKRFGLSGFDSRGAYFAPATAENRTPEVPVGNAFHLTATSPVTLSLLSSQGESTDAFSVYPRELLGRDYIIASWPNDPYNNTSDTRYSLGGEFLIIAQADSTVVEIHVTATTKLDQLGTVVGHKAGETWTVTLQQGETYLVQSRGVVAGEDDLSGSTVRSTKDIAVITGHQRTGVPIVPTQAYKSYLAAMMLSTEFWGSSYHLAPWKGTQGSYYRLISAEDGNMISTGVGSSYLLNKGEIADLPNLGNAGYIYSTNSKRFLVAQYEFSSGGNGMEPSLSFPMADQNGSRRILFSTNSIFMDQSSHTSSLRVVTKAKSNTYIKVGSISPKDLATYSSVKTAIPNTDYSIYTLPLSSSAVYMLTSDEPMVGMIYTSSPPQYSRNSYALSLAGKVKRFFPDSVKPTFSMTESCGTADVTIRDNGGLAVLQLLSEDGDERASGSAISKNLSSPDYNFSVGDTVVTIHFTNYLYYPDSIGHVAIYAADRNGNDTVYSFDIFPSKPLSHSQPPVYHARADSTVNFEVTIPGYRGTDRLANLRLAQNTEFSITSATAVTLPAGDSIKVSVAFTPKDSRTYYDTLFVESECGYKIGLSGYGTGPRLYANPVKFGNIAPGKHCMDVPVYNEGVEDLVITAIRLTDTRFSLEGSVALPVTISPKQSITLTLCFESNVEAAFVDTLFFTSNSVPSGKKFIQITGNITSSGVAGNAAAIPLLHPNPASKTATLEIGSNLLLSRPTLLDILGRSVAVPMTIEQTKLTLDVREIPKGSYLLRTETSAGVRTYKLLVK